MSPRPSVVCVLCALDDYLTFTPLPDDVWEVTCDNPSHKRYTWSPTPYDMDDVAGEGGIAYEMGLFDLLPDLLSTDGFYDEYGIIEYRLGIQHPDLYSELLKRYGHTAQKRGVKYTMSAFLGGVLGTLYRSDEVASVWGPATGYWSYNGVVGHYAQLPDPPTEKLRSWETFAKAAKIDPKTWPLVQGSS